MAFETGTAADHKDLLDKLRVFLSTDADLVAASQQYVIERWDTGGSEHELCVRGPGLAGTDNIYTNIITVTNTPEDYFNWRCYGATSFSAGLASDAQLGQSPGPVCMLLWDTSIPYWFFANGRHFKVVAKISGTYECMYAGFGLPMTDTPAEHPYPYYIGGPHYDQTERWSDNNGNHRCFFDPGDQGGWIRDTNGIWLEVSNVTGSGASEVQTSTEVHVVPWSRPAFQFVDGNVNSVLGGMDAFDVDSEGDYALFDALLKRKPNLPGDNGGRYMFLDGVAAIPGVSLAAEDTQLVSGDTWHVFANAFRTDVHDYVALKEE